MLRKRRICIYFGAECNISCKYCYRADALTDIKNNIFTDKMKNTLSILKPEIYSAVVASGGEPLIYFDKIKEVFACLPKSIHKKIMTNGTLLSQDMVNYINEKNIELCLSHDGEYTDYLRGVDVLKNSALLDLIKQVDLLTIQCVITNINCDVMKNYKYIKKYIGRDVMMMTFPVFETSKNMNLIENFDYDLFRKSLIQYNGSINNLFFPNYLKKERPASVNINYLLNGDAVASILLNPIKADITDIDNVIKKYKKTYERDCLNPDCSIRNFCKIKKDLISPHMCKIEHVISDVYYRGGNFL